MQTMNRIVEIFLNANAASHEKNSFENDVINRDGKLFKEELDALKSAIVNKALQGTQLRDAWTMLRAQPDQDQGFLNFCRTQLRLYQAQPKFRGYENSVDLQLLYFLFNSSETAEILEKFSGILVGRFQLIIAQYYDSKNRNELVLHCLVKAISCEVKDIDTMDSIGLWLSDIATPEIRQNLTDELAVAVAEKKPQTLIDALEQALEIASD
jgi:hypothetical protein